MGLSLCAGSQHLLSACACEHTCVQACKSTQAQCKDICACMYTGAQTCRILPSVVWSVGGRELMDERACALYFSVS